MEIRPKEISMCDINIVDAAVCEESESHLFNQTRGPRAVDLE